MTVKKVTIYTDSQKSLESIKNTRIQKSLIDKIRLQTWKMVQPEWIVRFCWVKAHAGNLGNDVADRLAKEAANKSNIAICYNEISKCVVQSKIEKTSVEIWQSIWSSTTKDNITE